MEQSAGSQEAAYEQYCRDVADSAAWGGELELTALAQALQRHMIVHSVGMPAVDIGPQFKGGCCDMRMCMSPCTLMRNGMRVVGSLHCLCGG